MIWRTVIMNLSEKFEVLEEENEKLRNRISDLESKFEAFII